MKNIIYLILGAFLFLVGGGSYGTPNANAQERPSPSYSDESREPALIEDVVFLSSAQRASRNSVVKVEGVTVDMGQVRISLSKGTISLLLQGMLLIEMSYITFQQTKKE